MPEGKEQKSHDGERTDPPEEMDALALVLEAVFEPVQKRFKRAHPIQGPLVAQGGASDFFVSGARELLDRIARDTDNRLVLKAIAFPEKMLWLSARRKFLDACRRMYSQKRDARRNQTIENVDVVDDTTLAPPLAAELDEIAVELRERIASLPTGQREALLMLCEGHSYAEISARLNEPVPTLRGRVHAARLTLKQLMNIEP